MYLNSKLVEIAITSMKGNSQERIVVNLRARMWVRIQLLPEKRKTDIGKAPYTEGAPMVHQDLSGRPANNS